MVLLTAYNETAKRTFREKPYFFSPSFYPKSKAVSSAQKKREGKGEKVSPERPIQTNYYGGGGGRRGEGKETLSKEEGEDSPG